MTDSTLSRHVGDERAARTPELMVERDAGGQGEQPASDANPQILERAGAVALEGEHVLAGPEHRLDALADEREPHARVGLLAPRRAQDRGVHPLDSEGELTAGVALVADHGLAAAGAPGELLLFRGQQEALATITAGRAWTILQANAAPNTPGIAVRPLAPPAALTVGLAWRPTNPSPLVHAFTTTALAARDDNAL